MGVIEFLSQPWHWSVSGAAIVFIMFLLLWFGGEFGVSANLRTMCSMCGAGEHCNFFDYDWKNQVWNLVFVGGAIAGGFIAVSYLSSPTPMEIAESTSSYLQSVGIKLPSEAGVENQYLPAEIFATENMFSLKNMLFLIVGGFMVGFGTRYAGGCTSGHAISGLSNLQLPSLIAVVGFFIGGLLMTWLILPQLLSI